MRRPRALWKLLIEHRAYRLTSRFGWSWTRLLSLAKRNPTKPDPQFLPRGKIQKRGFANAPGKSNTRSRDRRRGDGLGHRAMVKLSWRYSDPARHRARTDRSRFGEH